VFAESASSPIAVFAIPVVFAESAEEPSAVLLPKLPLPRPTVSPLISVSLFRFTTLVVALVSGILLFFDC
jgi:hypothetical protein